MTTKSALAERVCGWNTPVGRLRPFDFLHPAPRVFGRKL